MSAQPERKPRPRRWCDAGSPGRHSVTAAQKAGDEGRNPRSHKTHYPALSRQRTAGFNNPDGQAGSPPPQCPPNLQENRDDADGATLGRRDATASRRPRRPAMRVPLRPSTNSGRPSCGRDARTTTASAVPAAAAAADSCRCPGRCPWRCRCHCPGRCYSGPGSGSGTETESDADPGTDPGSPEGRHMLRLGIYCPATDEESP